MTSTGMGRNTSTRIISALNHNYINILRWYDYFIGSGDFRPSDEIYTREQLIEGYVDWYGIFTLIRLPE
jgi:hypothetical protein